MRLFLPFTTAVLLTAVAAISFARGAEVETGGIAITAAWARATPPGGKVGAAYINIENRSDTEERLLGAASPAAGSVSVHETVEEDGIAKMRPLPSLSVARGATLEMKPGGIHLMLTGLSAPLREGEQIAVTLQFEDAGSVTVPVEVMPLGSAGPDAGHDHHM